MFTITTTFIVYIFGMLTIGIMAARVTSSLSDYVLGGRRLGKLVTALSAGASDMSGWLLMGVPGSVFTSGISQAWMAIGLTIGQWCNWKFVAARLRSFTANAADSLTLPDYFAARFCDKSRISSIMAAVIILIFFTVYGASGMVSCARLFEQTFGMDYYNALLVGAVSTILYVVIGGFIAVSWTDTVQASLMFFALVLTPTIIVADVGSISEANALAAAKSPEMSNMFTGVSVISLISLAGWGLGYVGQPHILVRFMAAASAKNMPASRRISISWMIICLAGAIAVGYYGVAFAVRHPEITVDNPEKIFMIVATTLFSPWVAGILLSAILAAIMSTLSCQLLVASTTLTADFYRRLLRPHASQKELVWCGRIMLMIIAVLTYIIAMDPNAVILNVVSYAWAGFGASFGPCIVLSLFWRKTNLKGALCGMCAGAVTVIIWEIGQFWGLYSVVPGFIISFAVIVAVSLATARSDDECYKLYDKLVDKYQEEMKALN